MKWWIKTLGISAVALLVLNFGGSKDKPSPDLRITQMLDSLPKNWYGRTTDTSITFYCKDSIYRIWTNHINEPGHIKKHEPTEEELMIGFKRRGHKKESAFLSFRLTKKWTDSQIKKANSSNQKIYKQIKGLPSKHKIEHLYDAFASHKGQETYRSDKEEDRKKIAAYEAEKAALEKKIIKFPDYCSSDYSIFVGKRVGMNSEYEDIYPARISEQAYHLINLANEIWDCNTK